MKILQICPHHLSDAATLLYLEKSKKSHFQQHYSYILLTELFKQIKRWKFFFGGEHGAAAQIASE